MFRLSIIGLALTIVLPGFANAQTDRPSLDLRLEGPRNLTVGTERIKISGPFVKAPDGKRGLAIGRTQDIPRIPAHTLVGETGTIMFTFMSRAVKPENSLLARSVLVLRGEGRERVTFGLPGGSKCLQFTFRKFTDPKTFETTTPIEFDRWYQVACTWDGAVVRLFLDGVQQTELVQPYVPKFPAGSTFFYFGPYVDGYTNPQPWHEDSCLIRELKVYKKALPPEMIMAAAGRKAMDVSREFKSFLVVPHVAAPPVMDGTLKDEAWQRASSFITLIDGQRPEESLSYKDNNPKFCHDGKNLYVGFRTVFPGTYKLMKGEARGEKEPEVWADESFEFYLDIAGRFYRFGGNAAGGYCESLNSDTAYNGSWQYKTTVAVQIDNSMDWQGEICIPFETLGLAALVGSEIKINFGRTWRGLDRLGITALAGVENYGQKDLFATLKISPSDIAFQQVSASNPNYGTLEQRLQVFSGKSAAVDYAVKLLSSKGVVPELPLVKESVAVKAGVVEAFDAKGTIESTSFDRLLFQVKDKASSELLMQQVVPFKVVENYLDVVPAFSSAKVFLKPRYTLVKSKTNGHPVQVEVVSPSDKVLVTATVSSNDEFAVPFARNNAAGAYRAVVYCVMNGKKKVFSSKAFNYDGIGPWEKTIPEERVLPPFEPLTVKGGAKQLDIGMWGRVYEYRNSLLPTTMTATKAPVLAATTLSVNGQPVTAELKVTKAAPHRVELSGRVVGAGYDLKQEAWIEYDGVLWNTVNLKAKANLSGIKLTLNIPTSAAKFYHTTGAGFGAGGRRTEAIDKDVALAFWPVVWVGDQERGLCWFAESNDTWKTASATPIRIVRGTDQTSLEITFADKLDKGRDIRLEFGLLATPVKPLPKNYPFTMMGDGFAVPLNAKPPRAPVTAVAVIQTHNAGAGFFDLKFNGATTDDFLKNARADLARCNANNAIFAPYQIALFLPEEYTAAKDNLLEWQVAPSNNVTSQDYGRPYVYFNMCPASQAANYYLYRFKALLKALPLKGVYFDFGSADRCSNRYHGCTGGFTILAKREFYKRVAGILADANHGQYVIAVHNSETVQIPTFTFATHFLNGEGLRQMSSSVFHFGKDLLDHYTIVDFASEHSSLPWGITSSIYVPADPLIAQFGGDKEGGPGPQELYRFRMTKAAMAGALIHNTIPSQSRIHYGWFDKVIRFYDAFKVNQAEFLPYWRNGDYVRVVQGKDIYVSFYRHASKKEILAVIAHVSKEHLDQDVVVEFNPKKLGFRAFKSATELLTGPDPEYQRLYAETNRIRMPIELGDFGVKFEGLASNRVTLTLKHHSVALVKMVAE